MLSGSIQTEFDMLDQCMPAVIREWQRNLDAALGGKEDLGGHLFLLAGWSKRRQRMKAFVYDVSTWRGEVEVFDLEQWVTPWDDSLGPQPDLSEDGPLMLRIANRQLDAMPDELRTGGNLLVAELTRHGLSIKSAGSINPMPARFQPHS
jgi:hypothetical protein